MFLHRPTYQWWLCLRSYLLSKNVSIENWRRLQVKSVEMCGRTMCALCQQSHSLSAQVTESSSRVSGFQRPQIHKVGAGNGGKRREGVWGFNQGWSESLFEDSMGSSQWLGANSNPQVFRLNLLNFLNAAPFHAPMLQLAIIYKVSDGSPLPPKTNSVPSFSPALSFLVRSLFREYIPVTASLSWQTWVWEQDKDDISSAGQGRSIRGSKNYKSSKSVEIGNANRAASDPYNPPSFRFRQKHKISNCKLYSTCF